MFHTLPLLVLVLIIAVLTVAVMRTQLPASLVYAGLTPQGVLILLIWMAGLWFIGKSRTMLPWQDKGSAPDSQAKPLGHAKRHKEQKAQENQVSTTPKLEDYRLAVSDIFGGNAFLPVLFLLASLISGQTVLPHAHNTDIYLTGLGMLLTVIYIVGLIFRPKRQICTHGHRFPARAHRLHHRYCRSVCYFQRLSG